MISQKIECKVCKEVFANWYSFIDHFVNEHPDKLAESAEFAVLMDLDVKKRLISKLRVKYLAADIHFVGKPQDKVLVILRSTGIDNYIDLAEVVNAFRQFAEDAKLNVIDMKVVELPRRLTFDEDMYLRILQGDKDISVIGDTDVVKYVFLFGESDVYGIDDFLEEVIQ